MRDMFGFRATFGLLKLHMAEILAADSFEDVFQTLKNAPIGTFDANTLMKLAYEDDTVVILMRDLRAQKEVAATPRAAVPLTAAPRAAVPLHHCAAVLLTAAPLCCCATDCCTTVLLCH